MINKFTDYTAEVLYRDYHNKGTDRASIAARSLERLALVRKQIAAKPKSKVTKLRRRK